MKTPVATYRLQFRGDMDFDAAVEIVPYLKQLGISHLYASPIFTATRGSTHGYDVTNHNEIDPVLGGREGFERLSDRLRAEGMGLLLDIVPNHMAASMENPWWRDVVEWGEQSRYAKHFDIDWTRRLTLPILGRPFEEALKAGEISLALDEEHGGLVLAYFGNLVPLHPASWQEVLARMDHPSATRIADAMDRGDPSRPGPLRDAVREIVRTSGDMSQELAELSCDHDLLARLHSEQPWELTFWKEARRSLSYRRFFEITGLAGVRVEDQTVFQDVHRLTLELVRTGRVDGLRIDHVDGLADPAGYLCMLRDAVGPDTWIVVEKILAPDEALPADWPVEGTTGYEFVDATVDLLVDAEGLERLARGYEAMTGAPPLEQARRRAKREIATVNFEGELTRLSGLLAALSGGRYGADAVRDTLASLIVAMPVYRTYVADEEACPADRAAFDRALEEMRAHDDLPAPDIVDFLRHILIETAPADDDVLKARRLFQQLSSPAMAKGVEDTLFYRDHRLLALNEVGCEPERPDPSLQRFHRKMAERQEHQPLSLSATATHDTKRGEDARARLFALTADPERWLNGFSRWREANSRLVREVDTRPAPEPELEWMIYQALMAVWPDGLNADDGDGIAALRDRFSQFLQKAVREAKLRTSWTDIGEAYEAAVQDYASLLLQPGSAFLAGFVRETEPFRAAGRQNALSQLLIKLTAPGVPDIYQGSELGDFSLVDPDNRRSVDFTLLQKLVETGYPSNSLGHCKAKILTAGLAARRRHPDLFTSGEYLPLEIEGEECSSLVVYARVGQSTSAIVVAPRLVAVGETRRPRQWLGTKVTLPAPLAERRYADLISGADIHAKGTVAVAELLGDMPCALLVSGG